MNTATESFTDTALANATQRFRLADMLEEQAARPHLGDDLSGRVETLRGRAAMLRELAEQDARSAFGLMRFFQMAS